jgi:hypothetical protein
MNRWSNVVSLLSLALAVVAVCGCSTGASPDAAEVGSSIETGLRIGRTTQINQVTYTVTGPNNFSVTGSFDTRKGREAEGTIPNVPVGGPYTVTLSASSTDRNVTCSGEKNGIVVACPGTTESDETNIRLTCTRQHMGREWGDKDWRSNGHTFSVGVELSLACAQSDAGAEACTPFTIGRACGANNCGAAPDGCGGTILCGICGPAMGPCTGNPGTCECVPLTAAQACGVHNCGVAPDGCGGTVSCGACTNGVCLSGECIVENPCGPASNTTTCLSSQSPDCLACATSNGCLDPAELGGTCETVTGTFPHFSGTLPDGKTCAQVFTSPAETETQICLQTLASTFTSQCADMLQLTPCLCGTGDVSGCLAGTATPTGPNYDLYACDFNNPSSLVIQQDFLTPTGTGQANSILECAAAFACTSCFGAPCTPKTSCPSGQNCGTAPDGCGGFINCGACPTGQSCFGNACCTPATTCPSGQTCGTAPDGCGGFVTCGTCAAGQICLAGGTCCQRATACPAGQNCGTAPDGCGGTVNCGTCPVGQVCSATGQCNVCTPLATCNAGQCGGVPDGCGGTLNCGSCASGQVCGADNACHTISTACSAAGETTACLSSLGSSCLSCAQANGCLDPAQLGGTCEDTLGTMTHFAGTLPDGRTCATVLSSGLGESEAQICLDTLGEIFSSQCAAGLQETPCFCGMTPVATCLAGTATPTGPVYDEYQCDFDSTNSLTLQTEFTVQTFGAGQANALVQCLGAFQCPCF